MQGTIQKLGNAKSCVFSTSPIHIKHFVGNCITLPIYMCYVRFEIATSYFTRNRSKPNKKTKPLNIAKEKCLWFTTWRRLVFADIYFYEDRILYGYLPRGLQMGIFPYFVSLGFRVRRDFSNFVWTLFLWLLNMHFLHVLGQWWREKDLGQYYPSWNR